MSPLPPSPTARASRIALLGAAAACTGGVVSSSAIGMWLNWTPVPFWDMWDGFLMFYVQVLDGVASAWWAQHAEHRLVVGNVLFWLDHALFGGRAVSLIVENFLLLSTLAALLAAMALRRRGPADDDRWPAVVLAIGVVGICFSWIQNENLTWGFQASFYPSLLVPLLGFVAIERAQRTGASTAFVLAAALGVLSAGTMANGLAVLPMMAAATLRNPGNRARAAVFAALGAIVIALYFHDYQKPALNGSILESVTQRPLAMAHYAVTYLGGAFAYAGGGRQPAVAAVAGTLGLGALALLTVAHWRSGHPWPAHLLFLGYLVVSAFATAGGRLKFGLEQALSSRYMTYSLVFWATLAVASFIAMRARAGKVPGRGLAVLVATVALLPILWLPTQLSAVVVQHGRTFDRMTAALAFELGVRDEVQIGHVFPWLDVGFVLAEPARTRNLSVFADERIRDLREALGRPHAAIQGAGACEGRVFSREAVAGEPRFVRVDGWIASTHAPPTAVALANGAGTAIGFGIVSGAVYADEPGMPTRRHPFRAYVRAPDASGPLLVSGRLPDCRIAVASGAPFPPGTN